MTKKIISFFVLVCIFILISSNVVFASLSNYIDVPNIRQEKSNWCWAACSKSVLGYYGKSVSQSDIVIYIYGSPVNESGTYYDMQSVLSNYKVYSRIDSGPGGLSFYTIRSEIDDRRPMITGKYGHAYVVRGYLDISGDFQYMYALDPYYGTYMTAIYDEYNYQGGLYNIEG